MTIKETVKELEKEMACNCNLDSWQPEPETGHSWRCRIHKAAIDATYRPYSDTERPTATIHVGETQ